MAEVVAVEGDGADLVVVSDLCAGAEQRIASEDAVPGNQAAGEASELSCLCEIESWLTRYFVS